MVPFPSLQRQVAKGLGYKDNTYNFGCSLNVCLFYFFFFIIVHFYPKKGYSEKSFWNVPISLFFHIFTRLTDPPVSTRKSKQVMTSEIIVKVPGGCEHINVGNHFYVQIQGWQTKRICKSLNPALLIDRERNGAKQKGRMLSSMLTISCS